jgi:hypothetical protein
MNHLPGPRLSHEEAHISPGNYSNHTRESAKAQLSNELRVDEIKVGFAEFLPFSRVICGTNTTT